MYENNIMKYSINSKKPGRKEGKRASIRKSHRGDEFDQCNYMHAWKYHNETPLYN
jgi:hypothetical protein